MSMNAAVKANWGRWLLEHEDSQGAGALRTASDAYCCLGGLCELAVAAGVIPAPVLNADGLYSYGAEGEKPRSDVLPSSVVAWAGLESDNPRVVVGKHQDGMNRSTLASLNDTGCTFSGIWALIEAQL